MSMGRAVVTTDAPGCRQTVVDGVSGVLVPVADAAALATAMRRFVEDPSLAVRCGAAARARACEVFDVRGVNDVIIDALALGAPSAVGTEQPA
jgi:glycosyltransferase involved in cell wall biosynthesis